MGAFDQLNIAGSGLAMHQTWLDSLSHNIANVNTVRPTSGPAFQAQYVMAEPTTRWPTRTATCASPTSTWPAR